MSNLTLAEKLQATLDLYTHIEKATRHAFMGLGDEADWREKGFLVTDSCHLTVWDAKSTEFVWRFWFGGEEQDISIDPTLITTPIDEIPQWVEKEKQARIERRLAIERHNAERAEAKRKAEEDKDRATIEALKAKHGWE